MIYFDYSATTKVDEEVLKTFIEVSNSFFANPNSLHKEGSKSKDLIEVATKQIAELLKVKATEIIYTSGATESNNLAIKGICEANSDKKHIITTKLEHSSIIATLNYLSTKGYEVDFVNILEDGTVDIEHLKKLIKSNTILVTIAAVDSELGIRQPIEEIGEILKDYKNCFFHTDITQCITKDKINLENVDLASFSGHKFFCFKGIGGLYKKEQVKIFPLIHGGKSTSIYRAGTPQTELIVSMSKALRIGFENFEHKKEYVKKINEKLISKLKTYDNIFINSKKTSINQIINISILNIKPETFVHALEEFDIYISTKSACSKSGDISSSVLEITKDIKRASTSLRISISYKTKEKEIDEFLEKFELCLNKLNWK